MRLGDRENPVKNGFLIRPWIESGGQTNAVLLVRFPLSLSSGSLHAVYAVACTSVHCDYDLELFLGISVG